VRRVLSIIALAAAPLVPTAAPAAAEDPTCQGQTATIVGTEYGDTLYGTPGNDVVWLGGTAHETNGEQDRFEGGAGDDLVCQGGFGGARVDGGVGDDEVHFDGGGVSAEGGPGADTLVAPPGGRASLYGDEGDDVLLGGDANDVLEGGAGADRVVGGPGGDVLNEGPGSDVIEAGTGEDIVFYSADNNGNGFIDYVPDPVVVEVVAGTVRSGPDLDTVTDNECWVGTTQADTMTGSPGADCLRGAYGRGEDKIDAGEGDDFVAIYSGDVDAGAGDDTVEADYPLDEAADNDNDPIRTRITVAGGAGDDYVRAYAYRVTVAGGPGQDALDLTQLGFYVGRDSRTPSWRIDVPEGLVSGVPIEFDSRIEFSGFESYRGSSFDDLFRGSDGDDTFDGRNGSDVARGARGNDLLSGGNGRDVLDGGQGRDVLRGGSGRADFADGGDGRDRCSAERREECEAQS